MSSLLSVHGWLDVDSDDLGEVKFFLDDLRKNSFNYDIGGDVEVGLLNSLVNGWVIQESELNGSINLFYGRNTKGTNILFIEKMINEVIKRCDNVSGFFKFEDSEEGFFLTWKIENGKIFEVYD